MTRYTSETKFINGTTYVVKTAYGVKKNESKEVYEHISQESIKSGSSQTQPLQYVFVVENAKTDLIRVPMRVCQVVVSNSIVEKLSVFCHKVVIINSTVNKVHVDFYEERLAPSIYLGENARIGLRCLEGCKLAHVDKDFPVLRLKTQRLAGIAERSSYDIWNMKPKTPDFLEQLEKMSLFRAKVFLLERGLNAAF